jgi:5-methylthioribose kinase
MSPREQFKSFSPESIYLDLHHPKEIYDLLCKNGWIKASDQILSIEKPGEGNMNFVVRVRTDSGSIIVKQTSPAASTSRPAERIFVESGFIRR